MIDIRFKDIIITGFRSIMNELTFILDREPGLYFVSGKNLSEPALGSNGAGKSSIWDAISWVNFGKTVDGTKGEDIINWQSSTCKVIEHLTKDGVETTITRTQSPNLIQLQVGSGPVEVVDQAALDAFLNLDYDRFINCLIVGQFNATFLDYIPSEKLKMFSGIMPLELWEQCSDQAGKYRDNFKNSSTVLAERLRGLGTRQTDQKARLIALDSNQKGWEGTKQAQILDLTRKADDTHNLISKLDIVQAEPAKRLELANLELKEIKLELDQAILNIEIIKPQYDSFSADKVKSITDYNYLKKNLDKWKSLIDKCPTCEQDVNLEFASSEKKLITKELVLINKNTKNLELKTQELYNQTRLEEIKINEIKSKQTSLTETIKELNKVITELGNNKILKLQEIRQIRQQIDSLNSGTNPYQSLIDNLNIEMSSTIKEINTITQELNQTNTNLDNAEYWIKGFKELRMWVISDALTALEIESNNALSKLGLIDWKIKFQIERETQKGGISKGFHVMVHSKEFVKDKYVPLKIWSGGEARRLKLGGVIGFSSLIQNYTGVCFNISVWDEPSSYLSKEGIDDLIEFLTEQAETQHKVIYFIDQRNLEASNFKEVITMVKTEEGTGYANTNQ